MKKAFFFLFTCILLSACGNGQSSQRSNSDIEPAKGKVTYDIWKAQAKTNIRLLPEYGNAVKTSEQEAADQELINAYTNQEGTRLRGSERLVKLGFDYYYRGDIQTAMYRFNQAWLLAPKNENVYWGYASIYFHFGDYQSAMQQLDEGLAINPKSSNILTDKATIFYELYHHNKDPKTLMKAKEFFKKSYDINPKDQNTLYKFSILWFNENDCGKALKYYKDCIALGGNPVTKDYTEAIMKRCGN
jgi:tetratricopeptide (TPR) repeat protein